MPLSMYLFKACINSVNAANKIQMSEEIHNPSIIVPRSIMLSILLNGTTGFAMVVALLFCIGNMDNALSTNTGYPFMEIFLQATHSVGGSAAMAAIVTSLAVCATVGILASTSRMFWSFSRDHGLPFWRTLEKVWLCLTVYGRSQVTCKTHVQY